VVFRIKPSVHTAYRDHADDMEASIVSVSNTRNRVEPHTSAALVRSSATAVAPLIAQMGGSREPW